MSSINGQCVKKKFEEMSKADLCDGTLFRLGENAKMGTCGELMLSKGRQSAKFGKEFTCRRNAVENSTHSTGSWCEAVSSSLTNVTGKQAWKNGTGKLSQTFNNVRTTFGVLSQRIKKSTKKRQTLVNVESPGSPGSPCSKSRATLGRTPIKLYSPFSIDTPTGKENQSDRFIRDQIHQTNLKEKGGKKKLRRTKLDLGADMGETSENVIEAVLSNDLLQTQIGIYEFHSVANRIVERNLNN